MERLKTLVVEDEPVTREHICALVNEDPELELLRGCETVAEALEAIAAQRPDLLLLDVQLPGEDGFSLLEALAEPPAVIFITAYDKYALKAFEVHALDYLLKPFDRERFQKAVQRAKVQVRSAQAEDVLQRMRALLVQIREGTGPDASSSPAPLERLMIKSSGRIFFLTVDEIDWIEAEGNYPRLHVGQEAYRLRETLSALEQKLDSRRFVRIHRGSIVNLDRVQEIQLWFHGDYVILLKNGTKLTLSRRYKAKVEAQLGGRL
jgi:two-component system LytT family response regulator